MDTEVCAMGKRHEVSEEEWAILDTVIPKSNAKTGRPASDRRTMLNGLMWILSTGAQWRDLPERFGPWERCTARSTSGGPRACSTRS